jgi:hypothetical protein
LGVERESEDGDQAEKRGQFHGGIAIWAGGRRGRDFYRGRERVEVAKWKDGLQVH